MWLRQRDGGAGPSHSLLVQVQADALLAADRASSRSTAARASPRPMVPAPPTAGWQRGLGRWERPAQVGAGGVCARASVTRLQPLKSSSGGPLAAASRGQGTLGGGKGSFAGLECARPLYSSPPAHHLVYHALLLATLCSDHITNILANSNGFRSCPTATAPDRTCIRGAASEQPPAATQVLIHQPHSSLAWRSPTPFFKGLV